MNRNLFIGIIVNMCLIAMSSCVSKSKYDDLQYNYNALEERCRNLEEQYSDCADRLNEISNVYRTSQFQKNQYNNLVVNVRNKVYDAQSHIRALKRDVWLKDEWSIDNDIRRLEDDIEEIESLVW